MIAKIKLPFLNKIICFVIGIFGLINYQYILRVIRIGADSLVNKLTSRITN